MLSCRGNQAAQAAKIKEKLENVLATQKINIKDILSESFYR